MMLGVYTSGMYGIMKASRRKKISSVALLIQSGQSKRGRIVKKARKESDDVGGQRYHRRVRVRAGGVGTEMGGLWIREGVLSRRGGAAVQEDGKVHRDPAVLRVCVWRAGGCGGSIVHRHVGVGLEVGFGVGGVGDTACMLLLLLSLSECLFGRAVAEEQNDDLLRGYVGGTSGRAETAVQDAR